MIQIPVKILSIIIFSILTSTILSNVVSDSIVYNSYNQCNDSSALNYNSSSSDNSECVYYSIPSIDVTEDEDKGSPSINDSEYLSENKPVSRNEINFNIPIFLILSYWFGGDFLMACKRMSEKIYLKDEIVIKLK